MKNNPTPILVTSSNGQLGSELRELINSPLLATLYPLPTQPLNQ